MKTKTSSNPSDKELKLLRKEVEALKKQLARVQKFVEAAKKPDKVRAKRAVVDSLEVLNPEGKVVASIDKNGNLFIRHNDLTCNTEQKEIANLDLDTLGRIHRFLRLQKKTDWKYEVLDE